MAYWVYILYSPTSERYYCGQTENLDARLSQHNDPNYTLTRTTKIFPGPWNLVWSEQQPSRQEALLKERRIKKRGIKRFLGS